MVGVSTLVGLGGEKPFLRNLMIIINKEIEN